jgi:hypothetical protein
VAIFEVFGGEYLRAPNALDTARFLANNVAHGFAGMLGSIDCMHWRWKNYPATWHGLMDSSIDTRMTLLLFLTSLPTRRSHVFGILSLTCRALAMTSMCFKGHRSLQG